MTTAEAIIARLGTKPLLSPQEIADAAGLKSAVAVINAITCGKLDAIKLGGRYIIGREAAITYIKSASDEANK